MKFLTCFILWFLPIVGITQSREYRDKIYLQNGSILTGKLLKYDQNENVIFAISGSDTSTFHEEEIYNFKSPTWYMRSQVALLFNKVNGGFSLSASGGYQVNHWLALGLGLGLDNYYMEKGYNIYPIFNEARVGFYKKNKTPYFCLRTGYGFVSENEDVGITYAKGGFNINPVLGYRLGSARPYFDIFMGAKFQSVEYKRIGNQSSSEIFVDFSRYDLGFGFTF